MICILEINIDDSKDIYKSGYSANYIGILPPDSENLRPRIKAKLHISTENVNKMLLDAQEEIKQIENSSFFSNRIINDDFDISYGIFKNRVISIYPFVKLDYHSIEKLAKEAVVKETIN